MAAHAAILIISSLVEPLRARGAAARSDARVPVVEAHVLPVAAAPVANPGEALDRVDPVTYLACL
jgi:hypothetical protein